MAKVNFFEVDEDRLAVMDEYMKMSEEYYENCKIDDGFEEIDEDYDSDVAAWEDDSDRGCGDCPPDECHGHCMVF